MAREWEETRVERWDPRVSWYKSHNRKAEALNERKFYPESLTKEDLRSGDTRRFLLDDGVGDLLEVLRTKNTFEGLVD